ncbi:hypothetical protein [Agrobacterium sp. B1(2019)]|uniref:hypothetical protein n=1 Tax=Agrobacterium sp. B1(2019) TaxID=2607032 RepID=UPI0011EBC3C7|nr:hypothetical protein [Agrobacterium sp. B1(2019)]TZG36575.1 hypothetical protein AGR1_03490 [Agrobacterium sp. B1(2019)]
MGLTIIATKTSTRLQKQTDIEWEVNPIVHDWPRHPDLYGWLEALYFQKGGKFDELAGSTVRLDAHDIDELERAIRKRNLPKFNRFPCQSDGSERDDDLLFISKARDEIAAGFEIVVSANY